MGILREQLAFRAKGSLAEKEDWWHLCYDTESRDFYVEHQWDHMNAYKMSAKGSSGTERETIETWLGDGSYGRAEKFETAKAALLQRAGA